MVCVLNLIESQPILLVTNIVFKMEMLIVGVVQTFEEPRVLLNILQEDSFARVWIENLFDQISNLR